MSTGCLDCGAQRHRLHTPYEYKSFMVPAAEVKALCNSAPAPPCKT